MRRRGSAGIHIAAIALLLSLFRSDTASAQTFDDAPLRAPIIFANDSLPTAWPAFRARLEATSLAQLDRRDALTLHRHLYALISADAKMRVARGEPAFPPAGDAQLAEMFEWADRFGVTAAGLVAARLRGETGRLEVFEESGFAILFDSMYTLLAPDGWMVRVPHYITIRTTTRDRMPSGTFASIALLSTLFAEDSASGASTGTIAIIGGPADAGTMTDFWLERFQLPSMAVVEPPVANAVRAYRAEHPTLPMYQEAVVFAVPRGTVLFVYGAAIGAFETNRPHFIDVIESLGVLED